MTRPRATVVSLNQRIRDDIEARIRSGEWPPGHRIPSEHELMARYGCSRMTVNKVLSMLAAHGVIERRRRAGSFVARPHPHIESVALDIADIPLEVTQRGHDYRFQLLSRRKRRPRRGHGPEMQVAGDGSLLVLQSLHLSDSAPFALEERVIGLAAVPQAQQQPFDRIAPGSWLLQHVPWTRAVHRISAVNADAEQARRLQVEAGTACLVIERQTWRGEQPITYVRQMFLGEAYDLVARFAPGRPARRD
ncbi:histidine utilization repressor [Pseudoxanthomonas kalamensis DSM 18571]|uniref:histidine utilization repressor n=1 Tax=Pseudoxanthomonas kalamensis TaxID=289483 RepID=UPI001390CE29|nr:histidine utilization repressor [Pseudoxanthomonas kalamensis]KAF1712419.1 histidine utilization repressor [Pseudoxanthomonas kalamensis DSM 18571]